MNTPNLSRFAKPRTAVAPVRAAAWWLGGLLAAALCSISAATTQAQPNGWTQRLISGPSARYDAGLTYDSARGVAALFGGLVNSSTHSSETWEWNGTTWAQRAVAGPSARSGFGMVFDSARGVSVLFGGYNGPYFGETWEWNGTNWTQRAVAGPSPRIYSGMTYDTDRAVTVLFGGYGSNGDRGDTWEWNGTAWTQRAASGPSARYSCKMVYDAERRVTVLFGGATQPEGTQPSPLGDTWEWNGTTWTQRFVSGPSARRSYAMVYDSHRHVSVLFGGQATITDGTATGDTWEWNGTTWTQRLFSGPSPREYHAMAYDAARSTTVLFGGYNGPSNGETWELHFSPVAYVNAAATGAHDGGSWATAFTNLSDALAYAAANSFVREIWVARGTYRPDGGYAPKDCEPGLPCWPGTLGTRDRTASFNLQNNLAIYGGFLGTETSLSQRPALPTNAADALNPARATILSGDLNGNDSGMLNRADNSIHVVDGSGCNAAAILDGATVVAGRAFDDAEASTGHGGGLFISSGSPTVRGCTFDRNSAGRGGAVYCGGGSPQLTECAFTNNVAEVIVGGSNSAFGGAVMASDASPVMRRCFFTGNYATTQGSAFASFTPLHIGHSESVLVECAFTRNTVTAGDGGTISNYGSGANPSFDGPAYSTVHVVNCLLAGNTATRGAALLNIYHADMFVSGCLIVGNRCTVDKGAVWNAYFPNTRLTLSNTTVAYNTSPDRTAGVFEDGDDPGNLPGKVAITNCIIWGNSVVGDQSQPSQIRLSGQAPAFLIANTSVQNWTGSLGGAGNNGSDPRFLRTPSPGTDGLWGTADDDYGDLRLSPGSPAIDSGDSSAVPADTYDIDGDGNTTESLPIDLAGLPRFFDDIGVPNTGIGTPPVDRGCYEVSYDCPTCPGVREWRNPLGGDFTTPSNWTPSVPGPNHDTRYDWPTTYDVVFPSNINITNRSATIPRGNVAWRLPAGRTYALNATADTALRIGTVAGESPALTMSGLAGAGGGTFKPTTVAVGVGAGTFGTLTLTGTNTKLSATSGQGIVVGQAGEGTLNVLGGAKVTAFTAALGAQAGGYGSVLVDGAGSTLSTSISLSVFAGALELRNGGTVSAGSGIIATLPGGVFMGSGSATGTVLNNGTIAPGSTAPGTLTFKVGDYHQFTADPDFGDSSGQLLLDVTGTSPGQYDQLIVQDGLCEFGGGLVVKAPGDALAVPAAVGGAPGSFHIDLVKAQGGINLNSKFDVVFLPKATVAGASDPQQFFRIEYAPAVSPATGHTVSMVNQLLGAGLSLDNPKDAGATGTPTAATTADLDGDGLSDLILTFNGENGSNGSVLILLNLGADPGDNTTWLGFGPSQSLLTGVGPTDIAVFDLDGDGLSDIAVSNQGSSTVSLYKNHPAINGGTASRVANFETKPAIPVGTGPTGLTIDAFAGGPTLGGGGGRSLLGERRPVLVTANEGAGDAPDNVTVALSDPDDPFNLITLPPIFLLPTGKIPFKPAPINVDSDFRPDMAILCRDGSALVVFPNNSTGPANVAFGDPIVIPTDANPVAIGVVNLNGEEGLATVNRPTPTTGSMSVIVNHTPANTTGSNTRAFDLAPAVNLDAGTEPRSLAPIDLEGDGDDDLAVLTKLSPVSTKVRIFRNDFRVGNQQVNDQPTLVNDKDVPDDLSTTDPLFVLKADLVPNSQPDLLTIFASNGTGAKILTSDGKPATAAGLSPPDNLRRIKNDTHPACVLDYNLDGSINPDDIGDFITDYFTFPPIPGPGGYAGPCPGNSAPYDAGYKAAFTPDGSGQCNPPFPDNLGDFITAYFNAGSGC